MKQIFGTRECHLHNSIGTYSGGGGRAAPGPAKRQGPIIVSYPGGTAYIALSARDRDNDRERAAYYIRVRPHTVWRGAPPLAYTACARCPAHRWAWSACTQERFRLSAASHIRKARLSAPDLHASPLTHTHPTMPSPPRALHTPPPHCAEELMCSHASLTRRSAHVPLTPQARALP